MRTRWDTSGRYLGDVAAQVAARHLRFVATLDGIGGRRKRVVA